MKYKLVLSLWCTLSLITSNRLNAMSPLSIFAISQAISHGASSSGVIGGAAITAALVGPSLMRVTMAELAILALSFKTHRNTQLMLKNLNALSTMAKTEFAAIKTQLGDMHKDYFDQAMRNSLEHTLTQKGIADFRGHVGSEFAKLNEKFDLNALKTSQELADLKALMEADRATATERHRYYELQFNKILTDLETLKAGQKTGLSKLSQLAQKYLK